MDDAEKKLAMEKIKFPVIYDAVNGSVIDGDGYALADGYERSHGVGEFIAEAVNRHSELLAENEALKEMVEHSREIRFSYDTSFGNFFIQTNHETGLSRVLSELHSKQDYFVGEWHESQLDAYRTLKLEFKQNAT